MKRGMIQSAGIFLVMTMVPLASAFASGNSDDVWFKGSTVNVIEENLAMALRAPSPGMQASASQVIRDLKSLLPEQEFSLLVIPLMAIVKDENADVSVRMVAAIALHDLASAKGDFAIERVAQFTGNERMKHLCTWLTYDRQKSAPASKTTDRS